MTKHQMKRLGWLASVIVVGLGAAAPSAPAATGSVHVVRPGESIQKAVDAALPGSTVVVSPGTYHQSVEITRSDLTLRGAGERTVIRPAAVGAAVANPCADAGNGICVTGTEAQPLEGVRISSLTVTGFKKNGIWATWTDRLAAHDVSALANGQWGIAQQHSTRGDLRDNTARDNGDAGIFVANTVDREGGAIDTLGAVVSGNQLSGNRIGVTVRRLRNLTVANNVINGNCAGVFVVGDESLPRAGALSVSDNIIYENNEYCEGNSRLPYLQGSGIVLTGAEDTLVTRNTVRGNEGASPLSGGIVLYPSFVGAPNNRNIISNNTALDNAPADIANRDTTGTGNRFEGNGCRVSEPAGQC